MAGGNIKVVVRVRPFNNREKDRNAKCIVQMKENQTILTPPTEARGKGTAADHGAKTFAFDKSYWSFNREDSHFAGQDNLFADLGVPLLDNAFQGYNNCIFAYGQTGSGKSYSMMGYGQEYGVIPKICQTMFERIDLMHKDPNLKCTIEVSYLEIYNERVRDLLNPATKGNLKVREHPSTGPYVEDLAKLVVRSFKEIENLMDEGNKARTVAATNMNETSSRSHAVFTLTLTQRRHDVETNMDTEKVAKISLVDLAGSERATSTGATGARLKEGAEINRSLSTLGRVIASLADLSSGKKTKSTIVPYRDSVLTWLLKDSLGGNSQTAMIAAISPADINFEETLSTLRYADSAKRIKNHAVVNEDPNARMIRELKEELAQLRAKLSGGGASIPGAPPEEQYDPDTPLDQQFVTITQADGTTKRVSKAEIAEQLNQSEKLYKDLNQTWEEKLLRTEQIQKEREAALEELGISISKGFIGLSTPKKMPHLVNLSDDPQLAELLIYNLKPGLTLVGSTDNDSPSCEIKLNGAKIMKEHCTFENIDGVVNVTPFEGAAIMVNGQRIDKTTRLRSGNRIILGDFQIFRFNHPQEAKEDRQAGSSLLRQSLTANQLSSPPSGPNHDRSYSRTVSEIDPLSRAESPMPSMNGRDSDWSFARREAASAMLGLEGKIHHLTDEEIETLFADISRARALRKGRPESRLAGLDDDDSESAASFAFREKYMSNGTMDNYSLDTAITLPTTPPQEDQEEEIEDREEQLKQMREEMQSEIEKQKEEYQDQLRQAKESTQDMELLRQEKERMEDDLKEMRENMQLQLKKQKEEFEAQLQKMFEAEQKRFDRNGYRLLTEDEKQRALYAVERWRRLKNLAMAELMLKNAAMLKEAQVLSNQMDKGVDFQFAVLDHGQDSTSSYDMVLSDIAPDETDDEALRTAIKPCVAVRVIDFNHSVIHLWSLDKLERNVQAMRQMHQYHDKPEYMQHFQLENPFVEEALPQFSFVGDAHVPLTAVFEARVQDYTVDVVSPYSRQPVGTIKLSLEPSTAEAPPSTLKFNAVMHEMSGFAEREGTDIHAQLSVPGVSEGGVTTTTMIRGFDEGSIRFESVHSMSIPQSSPVNGSIQIAVFARISSMHLDKLISWDEVRELSEQPVRSRKKRTQRPRLPEGEFYTPEQHDIFARIQILEMSETGDYEPVEVEQQNNLDEGVYQLHQGLQRRVKIHLTHTSSESLEWEDLASLRIGDVRLLDPSGKALDGAIATPDIPLKFVTRPLLREEPGGTTQIIATAQWDSSLHETQLLDRPTADRYKVQLSLTCDASSKRTNTLLSFQLKQKLQIKPRAWIRPQTMFKQLWGGIRIIHSTTGIFSITLTPAASKRANDLWRLDSRHNYIKGEEDLRNWSPRGISLVNDYMAAHRRRKRITEVEAAKASLARLAPISPPLSPTPSNDDPLANSTLSIDTTNYNPRQSKLLNQILSLWRQPSSVLQSIGHLASPPLSPLSQTAPDAQSIGGRPKKPEPRSLSATILTHPKNPIVLKSGPLLTPMASAATSQNNNTGWVRRHAELRPPYLHLYSMPESEEVGILNLRNATVDAEPPVGLALSSDRVGVQLGNVWAVYATGDSKLFAVRNREVKMEWILAIDRALLGESESSDD